MHGLLDVAFTLAPGHERQARAWPSPAHIGFTMRKSQKSPTVGRVSRRDEKVNRKNVTLA
jgi:hypothetical protein